MAEDTLFKAPPSTSGPAGPPGGPPSACAAASLRTTRKARMALWAARSWPWEVDCGHVTLTQCMSIGHS